MKEKLNNAVNFLQKEGFINCNYKNTYFDNHYPLRNYNISLEKTYRINDSQEGLEVVGVILRQWDDEVEFQIFNCCCQIDCCGKLIYEDVFTEEVFNQKIEELKNKWCNTTNEK